MTDVHDDAALAAARAADRRVAGVDRLRLAAGRVDRAWRAGDERRWYVRLRGEDKDFTTVWLTLGQRTLRYETYVMPAPEENEAALYEHLLRRNERLVGAHFSIGVEDAVFLRGELPAGALSRGRARPCHRHALRHRRAVLPGPAAHRLRQPLRADAPDRFPFAGSSATPMAGVRVGAPRGCRILCRRPGHRSTGTVRGHVGRAGHRRRREHGRGAARRAARRRRRPGDARRRRGRSRRGATSWREQFPASSSTPRSRRARPR